MIVVSDTSPVTSLLSIGRIGLLRSLFGTVVIPAAVRAELLRFHSDLPAFLECRVVKDQAKVEALSIELDRGEAEAIALASEIGADFVLMDESIGRRVALRESVCVIGVVGVLLMAKQKGLVGSLSDVLEELCREAGFYLADAVKSAALMAAGE